MNTEFLKDLYRDDKIGLMSIDKLYKFIKLKYPSKKITKKEITEYLQSKKEHQVFKNQDNKNKYSTIRAYTIGGAVQGDLIDMNYYTKFNKGLRWILIVIDVFSRRIFLRSLKNKTGSAVLKVFENIEDEFKDKGYSIQSLMLDAGPEFKNKSFINHFKSLEENGKLFFKNPEIHNSGLAIVDRAIRTCRDLFKRLFVKNDDLVWIDDLNNIEQVYNQQFNKGIQASPIDVWYKKDTITYKPKNEVDKLNIGDKVRILLNNDIFNKKYNNKWSGEIYEVKEDIGVGYKLVGKNRKYFRWELLKVGNSNLSKNNISGQLKEARLNNKVKRVVRELN